jgi:Na+/melibiose symporter-like transporter
LPRFRITRDFTSHERQRVGSDPSKPSDIPAVVGPGLNVTQSTGPVQPDPIDNEAARVATLEFVPPGRHLFTVGTLVYTMSGLAVLFGWLLWGDFALSMRERSVFPLIEKFLLKHGASNTIKQLLTATLPTIIALIVSPIVSYRSDRLRSKWGRRIPFLLIPTPIAGLAMVGIAFCPQMGEALFRMAGNTVPAGLDIHQAASNYTLSVFTLFWTIFEVAVIISGSVFFGLINDVVPRPVLGRFHGLFRAVSLYDGIFFNAILLQYAENHFTLMFAMIGLLFGGGFTLMCLKVKEGQYPPVPADPAITPRGFAMGDSLHGNSELISTYRPGGLLGPFIRFYHAAITYLRECFTHPYYLAMFGMFVLAGLTFNPINSFSYRYAMQLKMSDGDYGFLIAISYLVSLTIAFPLGMIVDKVHAFRASVFTMSLYALTMLLGSLFVKDATSFGWAFIGHTILSGTYFTCAASLGQQLYPRSKFSQYASAGGLLGSITGLIFAPALGAILDATRRAISTPATSPALATTQPTQFSFNYHLTFWFGFVISLLTLSLMALVFLRFRAYGGTRGYLAPGDTGDARTRPDPPAHLFQILSLYFVGAIFGLAAGYVLAYVMNFVVIIAYLAAGTDEAVLTYVSRHFRALSAGFTDFHTLLTSDPQVRNMTTFCAATGVIPGAILGSIAGNKWANRKKLAAA